MKVMSKSLLVVLGLSLSMACTPAKDQSKKGDGRTVDAQEILNKKVSDQKKAEELALAGEQLVTPTSFMYADRVFDQALSLDSQNMRAQFYKAFLAQWMALRGSVAKVAPLVEADPKAKANYEKAIREFPNSGLKTFLLDGAPSIRGERDMQGLMTDIYDGADKFRTFLKNNKALNITLNVNDWGIMSSLANAVRRCPVTEVSEGVYEISSCDLSKALQVKLNRADIEALQQLMAGWQMYLTPMIAYDLSGTQAVAAMAQKNSMSTAEVYAELEKNADFARLLNGTSMRLIVDLGIDAIAAVRTAVQIQAELCAKDSSGFSSRDEYLFKGSLCMNLSSSGKTELENQLALIEGILSGQTLKMKFGPGPLVEAEVKPTAVLLNPIADLKTLKPVFNECDRLASVSDASVGGLFPNRDANDILKNKSDCRLPW